MIKTSLMFGLLLLCLNTQAQGRWFNFGELDSLRKVEERPVLVFLEAEWCVYCKKMKREAFSKADIQEEIAALSFQMWRQNGIRHVSIERHIALVMKVETKGRTQTYDLYKGSIYARNH